MDEGNRRFIVSQNFVEMFDRSTHEFSDCRCQCWKNEEDRTESLNYGQVGYIVSEMAAGLIHLQIKKQDRVAIMSENCPQWLWADFAIIKAAAISVPIYPSFSQRETAYIINDSGARMVFLQDERSAQQMLNIWDAMPGLEKIIIMKRRSTLYHPHIMDLTELRESGRNLLAITPDLLSETSHCIDMNDCMTIIYTSGTTGTQKGVMHSHASINAANNIDFQLIPRMSSEDILLSILPLSHSYERQFGQMMSLQFGGTIAYRDKSVSLLNNLQCFQPSWFVAAPSIFEDIFASVRQVFEYSSIEKAMLMEALNLGFKVVEQISEPAGFINASEADFSDQNVFTQVRNLLGGNLRFSISAAGALPAQLCKAFIALGLPILEGYGLVETCNTVNLNLINAILPGSVGPLAPGVRGKIDADGEWLVQGDNLMQGYWNNATETAAAFTADGYFKTGDIVEEVERGYIKIIDRKKALLILRNGNKVPTVKIENLFALSPLIDQVFAVGDHREHVVALVVPKFNFFIKFFTKHQIEYDEKALHYTGDRQCIKVGLDFLEKQELREMIDKEIKRVNRQLEDYEVIHNYLIINRRFSEMAREVTPTLKFKRNTIEKNFAMEIEQLYKDSISVLDIKPATRWP